MNIASNFIIGMACCVLAFSAIAAERPTVTHSEQAHRLQREGWTQSDAGVYEKSLANGEKLRLSIGEEGRQHDRVKLQAELASLRQQQALANNDAEKESLRTAIEDMQLMLDQDNKGVRFIYPAEQTQSQRNRGRPHNSQRPKSEPGWRTHPRMAPDD